MGGKERQGMEGGMLREGVAPSKRTFFLLVPLRPPDFGGRFFHILAVCAFSNLCAVTVISRGWWVKSVRVLKTNKTNPQLNKNTSPKSGGRSGTNKKKTYVWSTQPRPELRKSASHASASRARSASKSAFSRGRPFLA